MNSQIEVYVNIVGFNNYTISTFGNVKNVRSGRVLKQNLVSGYLSVGLTDNNGDRSTKSIHRLVANAFIENPDNKINVDHISRDKLNNHMNNLRWATSTENNQNISIKSNNTSGVTGVCFNKRDKKWHAQIKADGRRIHLGLFLRIEDAIVARANAEMYWFGEYRAA